MIMAIFIGSIAFVIVLVLSIKEMLNGKNKKYICLRCQKSFYPNFSFYYLINFGDGSKIVKCPHCGHKERMISEDDKK